MHNVTLVAKPYTGSGGGLCKAEQRSGKRGLFVPSAPVVHTSRIRTLTILMLRPLMKHPVPKCRSWRFVVLKKVRESVTLAARDEGAEGRGIELLTALTAGRAREPEAAAAKVGVCLQ
jgi:hypothetical protein